MIIGPIKKFIKRAAGIRFKKRTAGSVFKPYKVRFFSGDYRARQEAANAAGAICYVEQHFNGFHDPHSNYAMAVITDNASETSKLWGCHYAEEVSERLNLPIKTPNGLNIVGPGMRGNVCIRYTRMPAILVEPLFASSIEGARILQEPANLQILAEILADSIRRYFPRGGLVAFSIGHKGKRSNPFDLGVVVYGSDGKLWEADFAEDVLIRAKELLEGPE